MEGKGLMARITEVRLERARVSLVYPYVEGLPDGGAQNKINMRIRESVYELLREQGYEEDEKKDFSGGYKVRLNKRAILSLSLDNYAYAKGAAHGLTIEKSLTFNLQDGCLYAFKDLFKKNSEYTAVINSIIKKMFLEENIPMIAQFETIGDNPDFYLTEDALVIYFQPYEYTPYAFGFPRFAIPFSSIANVIDEKSPLVKLIE